MKILGITAEYNPFHNGHKYHVEKSAELTNADCIIAVMSGNFTQRGEPAILDKWTRGMLAVENGVDLVVELPFVYACSRAEHFARGAVDILAGLGADFISFGSESGDILRLTDITEEMAGCTEKLNEARKRMMTEGVSFAKANELAVRELLGKGKAELLLEPNNILALEYLKRISYWKELGQAVEPVTVKRYGSGYFDANEAMGFAGASSIRQMKQREEWSGYVPASVDAALAEALQGKRTPAQMEAVFFQLVRSEIVKSSPEDLEKVYCMGEGLENKLKKEIRKAKDLGELVSSVVSKRYTEAAVRRLLTYVLLGVKERNMPDDIYARVLAAGEKGRAFLRKAKKEGLCKIPVLTNINKEDELCRHVAKTLNYDILASDMYNLLRESSLYDCSDRIRMPYMK